MRESGWAIFHLRFCDLAVLVALAVLIVLVVLAVLVVLVDVILPPPADFGRCFFEYRNVMSVHVSTVRLLLQDYQTTLVSSWLDPMYFHHPAKHRFLVKESPDRLAAATRPDRKARILFREAEYSKF